MECGNIRERLSGYLDNDLSAEERISVEEHLNACERCNADLADLKKTVEHIRGMEQIEPPAWMAQKIMSRVRKESERKRGIIGKLFYPLHIKLPLEAVAAVLVVGLALYIYRDIGPQMRLSKVPTEEYATQTPQREIIKEDKMGPFKKSEDKKVPQEVIVAPERTAGDVVTREKEAKKDEMEPTPKASEPQKQMGFSLKEQMPAPAPATEAAKSAAGAVRQEARREAVQAAPKLKASVEGKIEGMVLTIKVMNLESGNREVEKTIVALGGRIIDRQAFEGKKTFMVEINSNRFNELIEKLRSIGEVKEEAEMKRREGALRMKIEVVEQP